MRHTLSVIFLALVTGCNYASDQENAFDVIIRNGTVFDGTGSSPYTADVAISGDTIAAIGDLSGSNARKELDANGMAVAPGFINMLSWANESLLEDGRSMSNIKQGVTLEEALRLGAIDIPLRRLPLLGEVANTAVFLASDSASAITGAVVNLTGGQIMD